MSGDLQEKVGKETRKWKMENRMGEKVTRKATETTKNGQLTTTPKKRCTRDVSCLSENPNMPFHENSLFVSIDLCAKGEKTKKGNHFPKKTQI